MPLAQILVEACRKPEHVLHVCNLACIPISDRLIEDSCPIEQDYGLFAIFATQKTTFL
jgi:hypothetical protein